MKSRIISLAGLFFLIVTSCKGEENPSPFTKPVIINSESKYYVDGVNGNDSNNGKTTATPWKTVLKVNGFNFLPGDSVLFIRGGEWWEQLVIKRSGNATKPIYYGGYGDKTKSKPAIHGNGVVDAPIFVDNSASYIIVEGFAVTNFDGKDIFDGAEAKRCGIKIGTSDLNQSDIKIVDNEVYFIEGFSNHQEVGSPRGTTLDKAVNNQYGNGAISSYSKNITELIIDSNYIHDCTCTGILIAGSKADKPLIQNNIISNIGSDGIEVWNSISPLIQYNSCINAGNNSGATPRSAGVLGTNGYAVCGMWAYKSSDALFQYNYCEGTKQIRYDGQPWDFDISCTGNCIYQFNVSCNNEGGFNLGGLSTAEAGFIYRYNISINDGAKQGNGEGFFNGISQYYNNIFYRNDLKDFRFDNYTKCSGTFTNNIFYTNVTTLISYEGDGRIFNNNCFFGHKVSKSGSSGSYNDPMWINPNKTLKILPSEKVTIEVLRNLVSGFKLMQGSPCINSGEKILNNGGKDFWGNNLYSGAPDIGVHEF